MLLTALIGPLTGDLRGQAAAEGDLVERVAKMFSPDLRQGIERLGRIAEELPRLPDLSKAPFASRYGYRSETLLTQNEPQWLQIDLEQRRTIDRILAVPAHIPTLGERGAGYGFPVRFRIEVSDDPAMKNATMVVDRTAGDVANPGRFPLDFRIDPVAGRYIRFTSTRHFRTDAGFLWALEELVVLSGNQSVATCHPVDASSSLELFPNWSKSRVQDGQSALGLPVTTEPSPSRGYLSAVTYNSEERKWLRVDLGDEYPIDEIRLVALEAGSFEMIGKGSFPRSLVVELSNDPDFTEISWNFRMRKNNLVGYPGDCALAIPVSGKRGRYLRLVTHNLWGIADQFDYGLAEIQVYAGDDNVALGKPVTVSDAALIKPGSVPASVTDGFSSRHRLVELPDYLDMIGRRSVLEKERDLLLDRRDRKVAHTGRIITYGGSGLGFIAVFGWGWMLVRQKTVRRQTVALLRDQIARDLHDDIGSNLGGIVLLSEIGSRHGSEPQVREDFLAIKEAAEMTSQSMQDIVWLIQRGNTSLRNLVARMRQSAQMILGEEGGVLKVDPAEFRDRELSLFFRRHFFFAFKESVNNVRKHAGATDVDVRIVIDGRDLGFEVQDNGVGFDPQQVLSPGLGLANLQLRADCLQGSLTLESLPGQGTLVRFKAPMRDSS